MTRAKLQDYAHTAADVLGIVAMVAGLVVSSFPDASWRGVTLAAVGAAVVKLSHLADSINDGLRHQGPPQG